MKLLHALVHTSVTWRNENIHSTWRHFLYGWKLEFTTLENCIMIWLSLIILKQWQSVLWAYIIGMDERLIKCMIPRVYFPHFVGLFRLTCINCYVCMPTMTIHRTLWFINFFVIVAGVVLLLRMHVLCMHRMQNMEKMNSRICLTIAVVFFIFISDIHF